MTAPLKIATPADLRRVMGTDFEVSAAQFEAITAPLEPAVVIAGAGSGKTEVMAARVVYLVGTGQVRADEVLGLTFTTKATASLGRRINGALEQAGLTARELPASSQTEGTGEAEILEPTVATYNAYATVLLTEHGLRIGHESDTRVMADASRYQLAARAVDQHRGRVELLTDSPAHAIVALLGLDSAMAEHLVDIDDVLDFQRRERPHFEEALASSRAKADLMKVLSKMDERAELLELVAGYRRLKARYGLMDFSDQISLAATLALEHPDVGRLEREKYKVVLLDEYQDTSVAQARMLAALFSGPVVDEGRGHAVTAVGDPNQAIYGWRGASVSNILNFADFFPSAHGEVATYQLVVNRRSDRRILEVANHLAAPLYDASAHVQPLEPKENALDGTVRASVHETYADELTWLAGQVRDAWNPDGGWREIGVLTRDNEHAAGVFDALTAAEIPVEIVGLKGLIRLPEVTEVVATLAVLQDLTANADLLALLAGPRWAIGPRDLALLGRRARELADAGPARTGLSVAAELDQAVAGADPTEVLSLGDALDDPGELDYSAEARERFGLLSSELRTLRRHAGEPLLDLIRRIIDTTGLDVELASSVSVAARARRDNLDLFVKAVADFQAVDGQVTLTALLAWLTAEDEMGTGLDVATPSEADSVKLLTVHRAKGLEWDAVFLVGVCDQKFPVTRGRSQWTTVSSVMPTALRGDAADQPRLGGYESKDLAELKVASRAHEDTEQLRLGYVAFTRARHLLSVSSYLWRDSRQSPLGPSPYQVVVRDVMDSWGEQPESWLEKPEDGTPNPLHAIQPAFAWPTAEHTAETGRRLAAAELVRRAMAEMPSLDDHGLDVVEGAQVADWDSEIASLLAEARADDVTERLVPRPVTLSATSVLRLAEDPDEFARSLARPMPRRPSRAARFGTRFHAWVEQRFGQQQMLDPDDLPGRADVGISDDADLADVIAAFEAGPFADRVPHAVEAPFALVLGSQVVRGRIDAVYAEPGGGWLVVDWKTGSSAGSDPLQLAIYRLAWAELVGVPVEEVRAVFHFVRTGETVEPSGLHGRNELERLTMVGARSST